ncbi:sterile alpha motif domain-containing protein 12-like [Acipenser ruthenus]|uniref:sterile alpha motif domain-containing protein 12-like n=1 Tax=Acipenser ruthenus TaxID=7906 RepID=UPI00145B446C|nr:sterile alpha motif domain-containing protein 12-like [Acipenser ruthenus]XP_033861404.1 sterile alpha motif domain-containing protein 12-like [Acipenser ruthenus]
MQHTSEHMSQNKLQPTVTSVDCKKRVSLWTVQKVHSWARLQFPCCQTSFLLAIVNHAISGRALLRLTDSKLERMGIAQEQQRHDILQEVLSLRVIEELDNLNEIVSECFFTL